MQSRKAAERTDLRNKFWPGVKAWTGEKSKGWFPCTADVTTAAQPSEVEETERASGPLLRLFRAMGAAFRQRCG